MASNTVPASTVDLTGRTAIVTGSSSGIGRAIAISFARQGADVLVVDIASEAAYETAQLIEREGGTARVAIADVSDENAVNALVADAAERWGRIDMLVNCAGIMDELAFLQNVSTELWKRIFRINVDGVFFMLRAVLPHMRSAGRGAIVNIASSAGLRGGSAGGAYVASKHAVVGLTRSVAWDHAPDGIRCNAICPGAVETNITGGKGLEMFDPEGLQRALPVMALNGPAFPPDDIAHAALFLVSDGARFINGVLMPVDGGWSAA